MNSVSAMEKREINGKWIYVFDSHNIALEAWAELKANHDELNLITLDHHTDTNPAFGESGFVRDCARGDQAKTIERRDERIAEIDRRKKPQIQKAVAELRNDEQIDAAIRLGIFRFAFCFNHQMNTPSIEEEDPANELSRLLGLNRSQLPVSLDVKSIPHSVGSIIDPMAPPLTYRIPKDKIFEICVVGCEERNHGDDWLRLQGDQVIESIILERSIGKANSMAQSANIHSIVEAPYVLDLDLDYFRTLKSLSPDDSVVFYRLIRNAVGITIATEPNWVKQLSLDTELTSECALEKIVGHIVKALA
jgi:hypothetical protein